MSGASRAVLERFEGGEIDPASFAHGDHVQVAYEMLGRYDFVDACARCAATIKSMAESVGAPQKFNATITIAFMSLIAERMSQEEWGSFDSFLASNRDLLDKEVLGAWYSPDRLDSELARGQFLLPDKVA